MPIRTPPATISDVVSRLDEIVDDAKREERAGGYFAALYRRVTLEVARQIEAGHFDDGPRMERLDVVFACRYLDAYDTHRSGGTPSRAWKLAFDAESDRWPIVVQHLLLGVNAHINLDLGIAAAQVAPGLQLTELQGDFDRINDILASMIDDVSDRLARIWPLLRIIDVGVGRFDESAIEFSLRRAREHAWSVACKLALLGESNWHGAIGLLDGGVTAIGTGVRKPGWWLALRLRLVRLGERGSVAEKIAILE